MAEWEGKSKATATGYRIFVFFIRSFGIRSAYFLLYFVAAYYYLFSRSSSRHILSFYSERLGFSRLQSYRKLYSNYYRFGQTLIDKMVLMTAPDPPFSINFDGEQNLREMIDAKKGGILLSAHVGNWEAAGQLLKRLNTRINIVMYDGEDAQIKNYLNNVTGKRTFNIIYVKNDLTHIFAIKQAIDAGEVVCMHADRFLPGNRTITCNFLGQEAHFPEGPFLLALKLNVPVAFVYAFKESTEHYHFYSTKLKYFYKQNGYTLSGVANEFRDSLEQMIRKYPEQWFNYYDFWTK